jgi:hypothetical protein
MNALDFKGFLERDEGYRGYVVVCFCFKAATRREKPPKKHLPILARPAIFIWKTWIFKFLLRVDFSLRAP